MSSSPLNLSGLASGVDTNSIVSQLMALERQPANRITAKQREAQSRQDVLRDVRTRLSNLQSAIDDLGSSGIWGDVQTVDVNDTTQLAATRVSAAAPGGYTIAVTKLARAEQRTFAYTPQAADSTITIGSTSISIAAGASLDDAVTAINNASGSPVYAVNVSGSLVLSSRQTGAANGFTASGSAIVEDPAQLRAGADADFSVDGVPGHSASNVVTNAIPGLSLTLKGLATVTVSVSAPSPNVDAVKAKVKAFVDQYNSTVSFIRGKLSEKRERDANGATTKGFVSGDAMLESVVAQLRKAITGTYAGALGKLADIGVTPVSAVGSGTLNQDAIAGKLTLDEDKLTSALTSDRQAVRDLIGTTAGGTGLAGALSAVVKPASGTGGTLDSRIATEDTTKKGLADQLDRLNKRLDQKEALLKRQFSVMEQALGRSQAQGQWLAGQLAGLQRNTN